jgi:hypothetical protein
MKSFKSPDWGNRRFASRIFGLRAMIPWARACACLAVTVVLAGNAQNSPTPPGGPLRMDKADLSGPANQAPDPNAQMQMHDQQAKQKDLSAANEERKRQLAEDSANLLKLATELKAEVDKTSKDTLSLSVIRKAGAIEKLAHDVKEKMKLTVGAN